MTKGVVVVVIHVDDYDDHDQDDRGKPKFVDAVTHREIELTGLTNWREVGRAVKSLIEMVGSSEAIGRIENEVSDYDTIKSKPKDDE